MEILEVLKNVKEALAELSRAKDALLESERMNAEISRDWNYGGGLSFDESDIDVNDKFIAYMEASAASKMNKALSGIDKDTMVNANFEEVQKLLDEINSLILK